MAIKLLWIDYYSLVGEKEKTTLENQISKQMIFTYKQLILTYKHDLKYCTYKNRRIQEHHLMINNEFLKLRDEMIKSPTDILTSDLLKYRYLSKIIVREQQGIYLIDKLSIKTYYLLAKSLAEIREFVKSEILIHYDSPFVHPPRKKSSNL